MSRARSGDYLVNDIVDVQADRAHPVKRQRPFAYRQLSLKSGVILAVICLACAAAVTATWSSGLLLAVLTYVALTFVYSYC
jgi:4-hydroxybenzoate polyprenyltransferase